MGSKQAATATEGKPWAIYARLSKAADGALEKVEHQIDLCRRYAEGRGLPVSEAYTYPEDTL